MEEINRLFDSDHRLETSIDTVFTLEQVNEALAKVRQENPEEKTIEDRCIMGCRKYS